MSADTSAVTAKPLSEQDLSALETLDADATAEPWRERIVNLESSSLALIQIQHGREVLLATKTASMRDAKERNEALLAAMNDARLVVALRNAAPALLAAARQRNRLVAFLKEHGDMLSRAVVDAVRGPETEKDLRAVRKALQAVLAEVADGR